MTNEEAIKIMKSISDDIKDLYGEYPHTVDGGFKLFAIDLAIDALEKQIPKKPCCYGDAYLDGDLIYDEWECPRCGEIYNGFDYCGYCLICGQALDLDFGDNNGK